MPENHSNINMLSLIVLFICRYLSVVIFVEFPPQLPVFPLQFPDDLLQ